MQPMAKNGMLILAGVAMLVVVSARSSSGQGYGAEASIAGSKVPPLGLGLGTPQTLKFSNGS